MRIVAFFVTLFCLTLPASASELIDFIDKKYLELGNEVGPRDFSKVLSAYYDIQHPKSVDILDYQLASDDKNLIDTISINSKTSIDAFVSLNPEYLFLLDRKLYFSSHDSAKELRESAHQVFKNIL